MKNKIIVFSSLSFILLIIGACFLPLDSAVVFYKGNSDKLLGYAPLQKNQTFQIQFTHSIHLSPVVETYEAAENEEIRQIEISYEEFAIGMPSQAEGNEKFIKKNGKYYIKNMNRIFPSIHLRIGKVIANHTFRTGQKSVPFSSFAEPGSVVTINIEKLSIWEKWKEVNIIDDRFKE